MKPAWSRQFDEGKLGPVASLPLATPITREWAWDGATGAGVKVAIIDSGVDADHPLVNGIAGSVVFEHDPEAEGEVRMIEDAPGDVFGHGTACAGIIKKAAPEAEIYSVRVLGERLTGKAVVFAAGLNWAIENGMQVCNLSLSTKKRDFFGLLHELSDKAYFRHVMLVSAINNVLAPSYPSEYSSVFSVACHEGTDPMHFDYNPSPPVEFGAPGIDITVAWARGTSIKATGNSFAAPHIAGIVTRILSKHPGLTPFQMKTILHSLADNANLSRTAERPVA
jgi:subtilisin family serine protease